MPGPGSFILRSHGELVLRGAIFDFDGVVVDSHPVHKRAWRKLLESLGRTVSEEDLQFVLDGRKREDILHHFLGDLNPDLMIEYGHRKEQFFRNEAVDLQTIEGLQSFLEDLEDSHVALAIASSGSRSRINFVLDRLDLKKHFRVVITADEVERGKPDPAVFLRAAQHLLLDPLELIAFEDAPSGVKAVRSAGIVCIGIAQLDGASALLDAGADHVVRDFRSLSYVELQKILLQ
jgi:beta-phosphoglucomutase